MDNKKPEGDFNSMSIHAKKGHRVTVTEQGMKNGLSYDMEKAEQYLHVGDVYTVDWTEIHNWHTDVFLEEFPTVPFNSVHFVDYIPEPLPSSVEEKADPGKEMSAKEYLEKKKILGKETDMYAGYVTYNQARIAANLRAMEVLREFPFFADNLSKSGDITFEELQKFAESYINKKLK